MPVTKVREHASLFSPFTPVRQDRSFTGTKSAYATFQSCPCRKLTLGYIGDAAHRRWARGTSDRRLTAFCHSNRGEIGRSRMPMARGRLLRLYFLAAPGCHNQTMAFFASSLSRARTAISP